MPNAPTKAVPALNPGLEWLAEGGEMGRLISAYNWSATPLGPLRAWPQSLRTAVSLILNSQHPMWIGWGRRMFFLYNDAYVSVLSRAKHPWALGRPAAEVWAEIWNICGPLADKVFEKGEASFLDDVQLFMRRGAFIEETYYSFSYSPIRDESGRVGGLFCPSADVSAKVLNARRHAILAELTANALLEKTVEGACSTAFVTLAKNNQDIPFALLYLLEEEGSRAHFAAAAGVKTGADSVAPPEISLEHGADAGIWPVAQVARSGQGTLVRVPRIPRLPLGPADQPVAQALVLAVTSRGNDRPLGVLIAGVNPARLLDGEYRIFYDLVASQLATAIQNARAAEEDARRATALAELDRAKTDFFSNVSHELRTPLTLMLGPLEDLAQTARKNGDAAGVDLAVMAHRNGLRLLKLVNTLLDFSRLEAGRMQANFVALDLGSYTTELASAFRAAIEKANLKFTVDCAPFSAPVAVDRDFWEKIVLNLLSNALKFTLTGGIRISLREQGEKIRLEVEDTGVGIPSEAQPRLFERFYRVEGAAGRTQEGTGIGLALVHDLVEIHGGTIRVESKLGCGTTFAVEIPRFLGPGSEIAVPAGVAALRARPFAAEASRWGGNDELGPAAAGDPAGAAQSDGGRILLVDDNADMRDYVRRLLVPRFEVATAPDGQAALELLGRAPPDLILSDIMMPRLDGFGLVRAVRAHPDWRTLPIILLSARAGEEARVEGIDHGADDYLAKPFSGRELLARVASHLELSRLRREAEARVREALAHEQQARAEAQKNAERLNFSLSSLNLGDWSWKLADDLMACSPRTLEIYGLPPGAPFTREWMRRALHPDDRARAREASRRSAETGSDYDLEYRVMHPTRGLRWVAAKGRCLFDAQGRVVGMMGVVQDITERREQSRILEETVAERTAKLRETIGELEAFSYSISHDMRAPLRSMYGYAEIVLKNCGAQLDPDSAHYLRQIVRNASRLQLLVRDVLTYSRVAKEDIDLAVVDLDAFVTSLLAQMPDLQQPGVSVTIHHPLPPVLAHEAYLQQIFTNLIGNALKFAAPGRPARIEIMAAPVGGLARISIRDNGIGIDPQHFGRIFEIFGRVYPEKKYEGTGIGLAIVKKAVLRMGGTITVDSALGRGSMFSFTLRPA